MREDLLLPERLGLLERLDKNLVVGEDSGRDERFVGCLGRCMVLKLLFLD